MKRTTIVIVCLLCVAASAQEWIARYSTGANRREAAEAVAVNDSGDIFVAGYARGLTLIKYSPAGETMWVRTRPRPDLASDTNGIDVAWWHHGTVLVAAGVRRDTLNGFRLVNFTNSGVCQYDTVFWHSKSQATLSAGRLFLQTTDNDVAYVFGWTLQDSTNNGYSPDGVLCKFLADPRRVWTRYVNHGYRYWDDARSMYVDSRQGIHIAGEAFNGLVQLAYAAKFDSAGTRQWKATVGNDSVDATSVAVAGSPSATYLAGMRQLSPTGNKVGFLSKLNTNGGSVWSVTDSTAFNDAVLDTAGNLYIAASPAVGASRVDLYALKYNSTGQRLWRQKWSAGDSVQSHAVRALLTSQSNLAITGHVKGTGLKGYAGVIYSPTGARVWCDTSPDVGYNEVRVVDAVLDPRGDLVVTGRLLTTPLYCEFLTMKFHPVGAVAEPGAGPVAVRPGISVLPAVARAGCRISAPGWGGPLVVADQSGRVVRTLAPGSWDLCDGAGRRVADGVYFILAPPQSGLSPARIVVAR